MAYVDGIVLAVPDGNRDAYRVAAGTIADLFIDCGAEEVLDGWGAEVPEGEVTSFPRAVQRQPGESVVLGWVRWPSREARDAGWTRALADERIKAMPAGLFDGKRMIFGGFDVIQCKRKGD